jgi:hypothetical protein
MQEQDNSRRAFKLTWSADGCGIRNGGLNHLVDRINVTREQLKMFWCFSLHTPLNNQYVNSQSFGKWDKKLII